ncbi:MAG: hypothetical protein K6F49_00505 [Saccharofermentans sp.]|nr:hypothetical protein [Saccharofermentans sp.]
MKTLRSALMVFSLVVILGIVGCNNRDSRISDDTEITSQIEETTEETFTSTEETIPEVTATPSATATPKPTEVPEETEITVEESVANTDASEETSPVETQSSSTTATSTPVSSNSQSSEQVQVSPDTPDPTSTPVPTATPTPTPEPVVIDIEASAQANGYVAIDIDMGNGTTQRIYGYYVDMSGLDSMVNDYRESIGLPRLPTETGQAEYMRLRAAECTVQFSHWRPNGQGGGESNITGSVNVDDAYSNFYNSDGHREIWEADYVTTIYSVGFRRMIFDENSGTWYGGGSATVQYFG